MGYFTDALLEALSLIANFDHALLQVVGTSLGVSLGAVLLASAAAVPLGIATALGRFPGRAAIKRTLNALMALPTVVIGLLLYGVLSRRGPLGDFGLLYTPAAMVLGQAVLVLPIIWNLVITAIESTDPRLALTCRTLGASGWQQAVIFVNEARVAVVAAVIMGFGRAIGEVGVAMMLGGNIAGYTRTMTTAIALETSKGAFALALALGLVLLGVALCVNALLGRLERTAR